MCTNLILNVFKYPETGSLTCADRHLNWVLFAQTHNAPQVDSEQTNSALGLGVSLDRDCNVKSAGGWLVQILPFCSEETLVQLEQNLTTMPSVTQMLNSGMTVDGIADRILEGLGRVQEGVTLSPTYGPCQQDELRDRMLSAVASLGRTEVSKILTEDGKIEVRVE